jgi:hypothetical protein
MNSADTTQNDFERQFFDYVVDATVLANAVQQAVPLTILSDADFECWWLGATRTSALLKVLMQEDGTGRQFIAPSANPQAASAFNGINIDLWAGNTAASGLFPLAIPYKMPASRNYTLKFSDTSGNPNVVEVVFRGFKLWPITTQPST